MEALGDVHRNFAVDEDRRYLFGFSMGGGGTWNIGPAPPTFGRPLPSSRGCT
jgi:predicted peptidase